MKKLFEFKWGLHFFLSLSLHFMKIKIVSENWDILTNYIYNFITFTFKNKLIQFYFYAIGQVT